MTTTDEPTTTIKVKRARRRLYDAPIATSEQPGTLTENTNSVQTYSSLVERDIRRTKAMGIVRRYTVIAAVPGIIPIPIIDVVGASATQLRLVRKLNDLYGMDFSEQRAKALIAALAGGLQTGLIVTSLGKIIPFGIIATSLSSATVTAALTYAIGRVFIQHFELGGTLLDFDPEKARQFFREQFEQGLNQKLEKA